MNRAENAVSGQNLQALLQEGLRAHQAGQLPGAEAAYRKILNADPEHPEALGLLGAIALARNHHEAAVEMIYAAIAVKPDYTEAYINLSTALIAMARFEEALASLEQALTLDPDSAEAHSNKGVILMKQDRPDDAVASYRRAIALNPDYAKTHTNLGNALKETGRLEDAAASHRRAIALNPDYAEAHASLGTALKNKGLLDAAVATFARAIEINPGLAVAHNNLGNALQELERLDDAENSYRKAIAVDADYAMAHSNLGMALMQQGRLDEAVSSCNKAIDIDPDISEAHTNLGFVLQNMENLDDAVASNRKALAINPENIKAEYFLATLTDKTIKAPPEGFVKLVFDEHATVFEQRMKEGNSWLPQIVRSAAASLIEQRGLELEHPFANTLDLGCGTGRVGVEFRNIALKLHGVDLSPKMMDRAREKEVYDALFLDDFTNFLEQTENIYDLIIAVDSLIYMGPLEAVFTGVVRVLRVGGAFAFTIETTDSSDFALQKTCHHAHSTGYVHQLAADYGFDVVLCKQIDNMLFGIKGALFWLEKEDYI